MWSFRSPSRASRRIWRLLGRGLSGPVWDEVTLDRFIADPASISPSTYMIYPLVKDRAERKKIIEFLKSLKRGKA